MFNVSVIFKRTDQDVLKAADEANFKNIGHFAASVRKAAASRIVRAPKGKASTRGQSPHTHRGMFFKRAIRFAINKQKQEALVGFQHSIIGEVGALHEFGESRGKVSFPKRPTMEPALEQSAPRMGNHWQGTIGS